MSNLLVCLMDFGVVLWVRGVEAFDYLSNDNYCDVVMVQKVFGTIHYSLGNFRSGERRIAEIVAANI